MDSKGQVAFEYLLTAMFGIILAIAAALIVNFIEGITLSAQAKILQYRDSTIGSLMQ